jgi:inosine-uridine nucleoside N-ribohydrolase
VRLWIDTDIGDNPDDAVALVAAVAHPDVDVVGISTSGGKTEWRADLARQLVDIDAVPGDRPDDLAARFVAANVEALLAIGPLTNIAALTALDLAVPTLTVMGGLFEPVRHRGRVRHVEWNFGSDPAATAVVAERVPMTLVPLDVTVAMRVEPQMLDDLVAAAPRLAPEIERWSAEHDDPVVLHDPLALLVALGDADVRVESRRFVVDPHDGSVRPTDSGSEHSVVVGVDAPRALTRVVELLR